MWTEPEWRSFCLLLDRGFPGDFDAADREAYRVFLDRHAPAAVLGALERWTAKGNTFRPSASELVGALLADPGAPTFTEAVQILYSHPAGVLHARSPEQVAARAEAAHPLIGAFVQAVGVQRLRHTNLDDPDWGNRNRRELEREWDAFAERAHLRQAAALTQGRAPREGLRQFSPLTALGAGTKQITEGER